jgi:hypothetical protein
MSTKRPTTKQRMRPKSLGEFVEASQSYTLRELRARTGVGDFALRKLRAAGLPVRAIGRKQFILGADWIEFLRQQPPIPVDEKSRSEAAADDDQPR